MTKLTKYTCFWLKYVYDKSVSIQERGNMEEKGQITPQKAINAKIDLLFELIMCGSGDRRDIIDKYHGLQERVEATIEYEETPRGIELNWFERLLLGKKKQEK